MLEDLRAEQRLDGVHGDADAGGPTEMRPFRRLNSLRRLAATVRFVDHVFG
jgi:hypothetical protein